MRRILALVLVPALALAGCTSSAVEDDPDLQNATADEDTGAPDIDFRLTNETDTPVTRTLDAPPAWRSGEWWRIRTTDAFTGEEREFTRVVTGVENQNYLVGMPRDAWKDPVMVLHVPGFGEIRQSDLSFEVHDARFEPLKFPLEDGATWDTTFEGRPVTAIATVVNETVARVELTGESDHIKLTYDAAKGTITHFEKDGYATYEVVAHGTDWEGIVTVPHMHDVVFMNFRVAGVVSGGLEPAPPVETVTVDGTYDRLSFATILGTVVPSTTAPQGVYAARATAPDGTVFEHTITPANDPGIHINFYQFDQPGGDWELEIVAGGPGVAGVEGIGYHVYDVDLPSGRILPSTGEHEHGDHD